MKWLNIPPFWLLGCAVLAWILGDLAPDLRFGAWANWSGALLIGSGIALMLFAIWEFNRAETTVIPHQRPTAIVTSGIFRYSRNPIYLGDVLVLAGLILRWDAVLAVPLVPALVWILKTRFIAAEERSLEEGFPLEYLEYKSATRRWI